MSLITSIDVDVIRNSLNGIGEKDLSDDSVQVGLDDAIRYVNAVKSANASSDIIDGAVLAWGKFNAYNAYCSKLLRSAGIVPAPYQAQLAMYQADIDRWMKLLKAGKQVVLTPNSGGSSQYNKVGSVMGTVQYSGPDFVGPDYVRQRAEEQSNTNP